MNYQIISDSGCDLTEEMKREKSLNMVPLTMRLGEECFVDDKDLVLDEFLTKMNAYPGRAMSSCPSPYDFMRVCEKGRVNFIVTLSSKLSGSYAAACAAGDMLGEQGVEAYVFDSKSASAG